MPNSNAASLGLTQPLPPSNGFIQKVWINGNRITDILRNIADNRAGRQSDLENSVIDVISMQIFNFATIDPIDFVLEWRRV